MDVNDTDQAWPTDRPDAEEVIGPSADGDPMGTPAADEQVLWKGRPDLPLLTRTAFHTRKFAIYFVALIAIALAFDNPNAALVCAVLGVVGLAVLQLLAWQSVRTTLYILTDARLIIRKGMAIETRINIPLKHIGSADLKARSNGFGDIAMQLNGDRLLGYILLWPHARPFRFANPQPMLRAVPDAHKVAAKLAEACAQFEALDVNLSEVKESDAAPAIPVERKHPAKRPGAPAKGLSDNDLEGAPA